ncbi:MAG: hypothetical protein IJ736_12115 [Firmicutes bacterium]|nr:hypothetical protein [Bacillota bacterium]
MYRKVIHSAENIGMLKQELTAFRARVTADKLHRLGIGEAEMASVINSEEYIPADAKGL